MTRYRTDIQRLVNRRGLLNARDGAIIDPVVDQANGVQWFFQYQKYALTKYKWVPVGEQNPLMGIDGSNFGPAVAATQYFPGPDVPVPFNGIYKAKIDVPMIENVAGVASMNVGICVDATTVIFSPQFTFGGTFYSGYMGADAVNIEMKAVHTLGFTASVTVAGPVAIGRIVKVFPQRILI